MGRDALSSVSSVVHEEELNVLGVVNEESLVAGGHHVAGLLVAAVTDLSSVLAFIHSQYIPNESTRYDSKLEVDQVVVGRTEGIGMFDLKRLRTRLSIPLGLRHDSGTHLKRSDWWRKKRLVPVKDDQSVDLIIHSLFIKR